MRLASVSGTYHHQDTRRDQAHDCSPSEFQRRIIFMNMCNDIEWWANQNDSKCLQSAVEVAHYARNFARGQLKRRFTSMPNPESSSPELLMRTILAVNQLQTALCQSGTTKCRRCIKASLILISTCLSTILRQKYSMSP